VGQGGGLFAMASRLLVLSASLMTEAPSALVRRGGDLLILAQLIGKALIVGHFSDKRSYRRPKEIGDSAFVTS
jgi:hypothetical protein